MAAKDINIRIGFVFDEKSLDRLQRKLQRSGDKLSRTGTDLSLSISAPIAALGAGAISAAGDMESLTLALQSQLGSAEAAKKEFEALNEAAKKPGLGVEQAVQGSVRLQGVGLAAAEARDVLVQMGNAIARTGGTASNLDSVTKQFSQMISKGRVLQEDVSILSENMPAIAGLMKQAFGTTSVEAIREMGVGGKEFVLQITKAAESLPRVSGGIKNSLGNTIDALKQSLASIGTTINNTFNVAAAAENFAAFVRGLADGFAAMSPPLQNVVLGLGAALLAAGPLAKMFGTVQLLASQLIGIWSGMVGGLRALSAWTTATATAFNALNTATKAFVLIGIATAVITLANNFGLFNRELTAAEQAQQAVNDVQREAVRSIAGEKSAVDTLIAVINSEVSSREAKERALNKLKQISPIYFGQLKEEKGLVINLDAAYQNYIQSLLASAKAEAARSKLVELESQALELEDQRAGKLKDNIALAAAYGKSAEETTARELELYNKQKAVLDAKRNSLTKIVAEFEVSNAAVEESTKITKDNTKALEEEEKRVKALKEVLSDIANERSRQSLLGAKDIEAEAEAIESGLKKLLDAGFAPTSKAVQDLRNQLKGLFTESKGNELQLLPTLPTPTSVTSETKAGPVRINPVQTDNESPFAALLKNFDQITQKGQAFGDTSDVLTEKINATKAAINSAIEDGYSPMSSVIVGLTELYAGLNAEQEQFQDHMAKVSIAGEAIASFGNIIGETLASSTASWKDFGKSTVNAIGDVIGQLARLAVANAFTGSLKSTGVFGPVGVGIAAAAGALAGGLFKKLVNSIAHFAHGTEFASGGLALVGEQGPELVRMPRGAAVLNNAKTNSMLSNMGGGIMLSGQFEIRGSDLVYVLENQSKKTKRIRGF